MLYTFVTSLLLNNNKLHASVIHVSQIHGDNPTSALIDWLASLYDDPDFPDEYARRMNSDYATSVLDAYLDDVDHDELGKSVLHVLITPSELYDVESVWRFSFTRFFTDEEIGIFVTIVLTPEN